MSASQATFADRFPDEARIVRSTFLSSFLMLAIGGFLGLVQALHRTGYYRGLVSSFEYYTILTAHGVFLAIAFTIFFLVGFFTWAVTDELDRSTRSTTFTWGWYLLMIVGAVLAAFAILGGLVDGIDVSADVLFTFYAPMQAHWTFYLGLALFIVGTWLAGVDWFLSYRDWRADNPDARIPLRTFMVLTTTLMWYIATIGVAVAVLVFLLPWSLGLVDAVHPLLTRTLFWYFGHPVVYFWLMPVYMMWYVLLPKFAGGRLFSDPLARVVFILFLILSVPTGIHHQYLDPGIAEGFKYIMMSNTMFLLLPSLLTAFTVVASIEHGARQRGGEGLFGWLGALPWSKPEFTGMALAGLMFAAAGFSGMVNAGMNLNYLVHNSLWIPGHFHLTVGTAVALSFMAVTYWLLPQLLNRPLAGRKVALVQVVLWFVGMTFMSNAMHRAGIVGLPRRTAEPRYQGFEYEVGVGSVGELQAQIALGGAVLFLSLVLFLGVVAATYLRSEEGPTGVDATIPEPLSGPDHSPAVLDNLKLWATVAIVLVVLAYTLPLAAIIDNAGLWGYEIEGYGLFAGVIS